LFSFAKKPGSKDPGIRPVKDKMHRFVTGAGLLLALAFIVVFIETGGGSESEGLLFSTIIYFTIIQRIIYFVAYGDKKEKWIMNYKK